MCDCLAALTPATQSSAAAFAKNSDRPPGEAQCIEWLASRIDDGPVRVTYIEVEPYRRETIGALVSRPWWCWGVEHGVNAAGVAIGNERIFTTLDPRGVPPALVGMDLVRLGLERGATAAEAVDVMIDLLERYGQGGSGQHGVDRPYWSSFLVVDAGEGWVLETSGRTWATERFTRSRAISNRTTIFEFDAVHRHPRQPVEVLVDPRLRASERVLAREPVSVADLIGHLRSHVGEARHTVCMHQAPDDTTAAVVAELPAGGPPVAHMLLGWPCRSIFVTLVVGQPLGEPVEWARFAALQPQHREALVALERELRADVAVADPADWNPEAWRRVDALLSSLGA